MENNGALKIKNQGRKLLSADINTLEKISGNEIPAPYRDFLMENNGGEFYSMHVISINGLKGKFSDVRLFLGIDDPIESCNILWNLDLLKESLPRHNLLPIASDSGGGLFCLNFDTPNKGSVVFITSPFDEFFGIYRVSDDFNDFLCHIVEYID